jgi:hypothetical protein
MGRQHQRGPVGPTTDELGGEEILGLGVARVLSSEEGTQAGHILLKLAEDQIGRAPAQHGVDGRRLDLAVLVRRRDKQLARRHRSPAVPSSRGVAAGQGVAQTQIYEGLTETVPKPEVLAARTGRSLWRVMAREVVGFLPGILSQFDVEQFQPHGAEHHLHLGAQAGKIGRGIGQRRQCVDGGVEGTDLVTHLAPEFVTRIQVARAEPAGEIAVHGRLTQFAFPVLRRAGARVGQAAGPRGHALAKGVGKRR